MTRIAVLSDAHGNLPALQAVVADIQPCRPDAILYAGDFTRGPFANEVIALLREQQALMIRGNDDAAVLRYADDQAPAEWRSAKSFALLRWTASHLSAESLSFLGALPEQRVVDFPGAGGVRVVHVSPSSPRDALHPQHSRSALEQALEGIGETALVCGHSHQPWRFAHRGKLALNPGAVAGTLREKRAQYAWLCHDGRRWQAELREIPYDFEALRRGFITSGLLEEGGPMARGFLLSMQTGRDYMMAFYRYAEGRAKEAGCASELPIPDEIWTRAEETFDWETLPEPDTDG